jgi:hypothetical protein
LISKNLPYFFKKVIPGQTFSSLDRMVLVKIKDENLLKALTFL